MKTVCVFDSGVGGLSVLRALLAALPQVRFVYLADSANAPYGERGAEWVQARSHRIVEAMREAYAPDAIVIACNTATALAIDSLREHHPNLPFVGVEPALKPAATITRTGQIGVMATRGTLESPRFDSLCQRVQSSGDRGLFFHRMPCDGLADAIEREDALTIRTLCDRYLSALRAKAPEGKMIDTLVLGCTHYPFVADTLSELAGTGVTLVETGTPVARRTQALLQLPEKNTELHATHIPPLLLTTGAAVALANLARRWLALECGAQHWSF